MDLLGPIHDIFVVFLGSILILGGLRVVLLMNPIDYAFSLGLVLVCIFLFYISLNSYFVIAAQFLIYGAINVLIIFVVMFMNSSEYSNGFYLWTVGDRITSQICISIFFSLMTIIPDTSWYGIFRTTKSNQIIEQDLISNVQQIGIYLSTDFYLPFELISIILLSMMLEFVLFLSVSLFSIGIYGLITSRSVVRALMCLELRLNSTIMNLVAFSDIFDSRQLKGEFFAIFVITIVAAEAAIGLAIISLIYRNRKTIHINQSNLLKK
ncbi:hypothetical protein KSP40_PGU016852 [Platanthera guangdongensis]|uniref:NAD(P)H-quinone oxidoreductase subunit 6, chloroplastic n=1 Tax=Platanthera guangdongensis TaxID=2320717 RepID=A0ABR2LIU7_9ASPA